MKEGKKANLKGPVLRGRPRSGLLKKIVEELKPGGERPLFGEQDMVVNALTLFQRQKREEIAVLSKAIDSKKTQLSGFEDELKTIDQALKIAVGYAKAEKKKAD